MKIIKTGKPLSERESESLNIYLNEIGKETILSDDEEKQLSKQIMAGGAAAERAIGKLTSANLRFVVSIAKQYVDRGVAILDLISEGNIGLMKAARSFDGSRGLRFVAMPSLLFARQLRQLSTNRVAFSVFPSMNTAQKKKPTAVLFLLMHRSKTVRMSTYSAYFPTLQQRDQTKKPLKLRSKKNFVRP